MARKQVTINELEELKNDTIATGEKLNSALGLANKNIQVLNEMISKCDANLEEINEKIPQYLEEAKSTADKITQAHSEIFESADETTMSLIDSVKSVHEEIINLYNEANQLIKGSFRTSRGKEIPATQISSIDKDKYTQDVSTKKYYEKLTTRIPGIIEEVKDEVSSLESRTEKLEDEINTLISGFKSEFEVLKDKIVDLLPSAMSAGLAAGYEDAKKDHKRQARLWKIIFSLCIVAFVVIAAIVKPTLPADHLNPWNSLLLRILNIAPLEIPIVWLGIVSVKKINQYSMLYEEYLHKWAISKTFAGMSNAILESQDEDNSELLNRLYTHTLEAYARNPSSAFDKRHSSDTPVAIIKELAESVSELPKKIVEPFVQKKDKNE